MAVSNNRPAQERQSPPPSAPVSNPENASTEASSTPETQSSGESTASGQSTQAEGTAAAATDTQSARPTSSPPADTASSQPAADKPPPTREQSEVARRRLDSDGGIMHRISQTQQKFTDTARSVLSRVPWPEPVRNAVSTMVNPAQGLDEAGERRVFEADLELKGSVGRKNWVGKLGLKAKGGINATVERRADGDLDMSVEQRLRVTGTGEAGRKSTRGEGKAGFEFGGELNVTETYTTTDAELPQRWATVVQDKGAEALGLANPGARLLQPLVAPSSERMEALEQDRSSTTVELNGFLRGQVGLKYGPVLGTESTSRDDWVAGGSVEIQHPRFADDGSKVQDGAISLTLRLDHDKSLKSGFFADAEVVGGKVQELSDLSSNQTTVTLTWNDRDIHTRDQVLEALNDIRNGDMGLPSEVTVANTQVAHELVDDDGLRVAVDGTHTPYTETTTEITANLEGATGQDLRRLMRGDTGVLSSMADVEASQTTERYSPVGPDIDLKPEVKVKKVALEGGAAVELETFGTELESRHTEDLTPREALRTIAVGTSEILNPGTGAPAAEAVDPNALPPGHATPKGAPAAEARVLLGQGSAGPEVEDLQRRLNAEGSSIEEDGIFGPETEGAVRDFQQESGIAADGVVGDDTWGALVSQADPSRAAPGSNSAQPMSENPDGVATDPSGTGAASTAEVPKAQELIDTYNQFHALDSELPALSDEQQAAIRELNPTERQMFNQTLEHLSALQQGEISGAEYMFAAMDSAAVLAENSDDGTNLNDLVGMAFSAGPADGAMGVFRRALGTEANVAGSALHRMEQGILHSQGLTATHTGFNDNIINHSRAIDDQVRNLGPTDTITHHFREFFVAGFNGQAVQGNLPGNPFEAYEVARHIDDGVTGIGLPFVNHLLNEESEATRNEGDIRNGMFAAMMGEAYARGDLTANQVAQLTEWAFSANPTGGEPPWGMTANNGTIENPGHWVGREHYDSEAALNVWIDAYREAHPNAEF